MCTIHIPCQCFRIHASTARLTPSLFRLQPVEERAFFEQMWSQNFTRSKVKYEMPMEVLTASTTISLSSFSDEETVPGGRRPSNCDLEAFDALDGDGSGAAEVPTSAPRNSAVEVYFDPHCRKGYNRYDLKTVGPHQHHHTMVNKKVKGAGQENDLTVLVRGDNVFGTTASKNFRRVDQEGRACSGFDTISISIASYRVVEVRAMIKCALAHHK